MKSITKKEHRRRIQMAIQVYSGHTLLMHGAEYLGLSAQGFHAWVQRHAEEIVITTPAPGALKCDYCSWYFKDAYALGGHMAAHPGLPMLHCSGCRRRLTAENRSATAQTRSAYCKLCARAKRTAWLDKADNRRGVQDYARQRAKAVRERVLDAYGKQCACCGEAGKAFLTIDHVNGQTAASRRIGGGTTLYAWLIKHDFPDGFQVLCYNCNCAKRDQGECPHVWMRQNRRGARRVNPLTKGAPLSQ